MYVYVLRVSVATNLFQLQLAYKTFVHCHNLRFNRLSRILTGWRLNYSYDLNIIMYFCLASVRYMYICVNLYVHT